MKRKIIVLLILSTMVSGYQEEFTLDESTSWLTNVLGGFFIDIMGNLVTLGVVVFLIIFLIIMFKVVSYIFEGATRL